MKKLLAAFLLLISINSYAAEQVTIEADNVDSTDQNIYHATGNVKIFQGERTMLADEVFYYKDINYLEAMENVRLSENGETIDCSRMEYDAERQTGVFYNADAFLEPFSWFKADEARKTDDKSYFLKGARYTTCSGDAPSWSISASSAKIDVGGYLSAFNVTAWARSLPVFYTPYIIYPIKTERESGFLLPAVGTSSKDGLFVQPQYFLNLGVDKDMTFGVLLSQKSDPLYANELRMRPSAESFFYNYMEYTGEDFQTPRQDPDNNNVSRYLGRYFIYNRSHLKLADNLYLNIGLETVSDYSYLDDFITYSLLKGYDNDDEDYINNIQLNYFSRLSNITLKYNDTLNYTVTSAFKKEHTYVEPSVIAEQDISDLPIRLRYYASYDKVRNTAFTYNYYTGKEDSRVLDYNRNHFSFMLYKPISVYIGTFTPSVKLYYTKWYDIKSNQPLKLPSDDDDSSMAYLDTDGNTITRRLYTQKHTFKLNEIYRNYDSFKHSVYNSFSYIQTPDINQTNLFDYVYEDIIEKAKKYEYSLQNFFKGKEWYLKLENIQGYELTRDEDRFEPLITQITYVYPPVFSFYLKDEYNYYDSDTDFFTANGTFRYNNFVISGRYTYDKDTSDDQNTTIAGTITYTTPKYDLSYTRTSSGWNNELSLKTETSVDDSLTLSYKSECWQFGVTYSRRTEIDNVAYSNDSTTEHVVMLTIGLRGLGQYSSAVYRETSMPDGGTND